MAYWQQKKFVDLAVHVPGVVVGNDAQEGSEGEVTYHAVFEFHLLTGEVVQATSHTGSRSASHKKGDSVKVLYEDADPQHAEIDSYWDLFFLPIILTGLGFCMFLLTAFVLYVLSRKSTPKKR